MNEAHVSTTFTASKVKPAAEPLAESPYLEAVADFLSGPLESCSRYHGRLVANVHSHPLIAALHGAFISHRPISLSPDIIWLTITQGLAIHINENAERLRRRFVSHDGKLKIEVRRDDFVKGTPENPWPEVFSKFSGKIREHIGGTHERIVANFSTTGPVERAASELALLDSMQTYFDYDLCTLCGIPSITLEGIVDDWRSIAARAKALAEFELGWWIEPLLPVLNEFARAASGRISRRFWKSIYKYNGMHSSGTPYVTGWVVQLFPYITSSPGKFERNPWLVTRSKRCGPERHHFPNTPARAPFRWTIGNLLATTTYDMEFLGGLIGVSQNPNTLCLRPEIGWAVRDVDQVKAVEESADR